MKFGKLYFALAILYLVPIWSVAHLPTSDGPSHVYNSWILRELIAGNSGPISRFFEIGLRRTAPRQWSWAAPEWRAIVAGSRRSLASR